jgi:DNA mismatch repair protein MutS
MISEDQLKEFVELCDTSTFEGTPSIFSHTGNVLRAHALMYEQKEKLVPLIHSFARFDVYCGLARLMNEHEKFDYGFCFPVYTASDKPFVSCQEFWHPMIDVKKVVANSVELGVNGARSNMIITGPNAGGKSSTLKALALSLWMAQTLGIAPAQRLEFTPFQNIQTYLNITDDVGVGNSLFKAEVLRTQKLIDTIKKARQGEYSFVVFDEVFNGTSHVEGAAAAYSVAKQLSVFDHSISLIATHFPLLTKLEQDTPTFSNYKVTVDVYRNGSITYPFKLHKGIADQHVALQILRNEGFEGSLIDEAEKLVHQME